MDKITECEKSFYDELYHDESDKYSIVRDHVSGRIWLRKKLTAANILMTDDGTVKIIDYDAAKVFNQNETRDTMLIGTKGSALSLVQLFSDRGGFFCRFLP